MSMSFLSEDALAKWVIENSPRRIPIASRMPFEGIEGDDFHVNPLSTASLPEGVVQTAAAPISDQSSSPAGAQRKYQINLIVTRYVLSYFNQDRLTYPNDIDALQAADAIRRLIYGFYKNLPAVLNGSSFLDPANLVNTGGAMSFTDLNDAYHRVTANSGRPNAIMSSLFAKRTYLDLCNNNGFLPQYVEVDQPDPVSGTVRAPMLAMHGTPWYVNDFMDDPEPDYSNRIYFMVLGDNGKPGDGRGITGIVPKRNLGNFFIRRESTPDAENICVDYTWPVGVASGSLGALSAYDFTP